MNVLEGNKIEMSIFYAPHYNIYRVNWEKGLISVGICCKENDISFWAIFFSMNSKKSLSIFRILNLNFNLCFAYCFGTFK